MEACRVLENVSPMDSSVFLLSGFLGFAAIIDVKSTAFKYNAWCRENPFGLSMAFGALNMVNIITEV
jgi:hypothetical protein